MGKMYNRRYIFRPNLDSNCQSEASSMPILGQSHTSPNEPKMARMSATVTLESPFKSPKHVMQSGNMHVPSSTSAMGSKFKASAYVHPVLVQAQSMGGKVHVPLSIVALGS